MISRVFCLWVAIVSTGLSSANAAKEKPVKAKKQVASQAAPVSFNEFTSRFTVKISAQVANMFSAQPASWHGTGFLAEIRKDANGKEIGVIWTNDHVAGSDMIQVRELKIAFSTDTEVPETVKAEVVYQSQLIDFAVLEFPMESLKRSRARVQPARFPSPDSPFYNFVKNQRDLQGVDTLAQGNPFDSENIITFGKITGSWSHFMKGTYIQTQTPINPGNSGGPLIELATKEGLVIGINSAGIPGANNVGYAIPIGTVIEEYNEWRRNPALARQRQLLVRWGRNRNGALKISGAKDVIEGKYPDYFHHFTDTLRVEDSDPRTMLKTGDQVVKVNGALVGPSVYEMSLRMQMSGKSVIPFEIVRDGKIIEVAVPVTDTSFQTKRKRLDYVYIAGLVFREVAEAPLWWVDHTLKSRVMIMMMLQSPEISFHAATMPDPNSILVGVTIEGETYEVNRLRDLRKALNQHKRAKFARLIVREPLYNYDDEGSREMYTDRNGNLHFEGTTATYDLPLIDVKTPRHVSMKKFSEQFSFEADRPETRDWRKFKSCEVALAPVKPPRKTR